MEHFYPTSIGPSVPGRYLDPSTTPSSSTVKGTLARYSQTLCRWADGAATVSGSDSWQRWGGRRLSNNKDSVLPTHCALRMDPPLIHPAPPELRRAPQHRPRYQLFCATRRSLGHRPGVSSRRQFPSQLPQQPQPSDRARQTVRGGSTNPQLDLVAPQFHRSRQMPPPPRLRRRRRRPSRQMFHVLDHVNALKPRSSTGGNTRRIQSAIIIET